MYRPLEKSYKGAYPFKLGTTSYIYPDHMVPNVKMLAPYLDEIELLFFENRNDSRPSAEDIGDMRLLAEEFDLSYNVHLPLDIFPGSTDSRVRRHAVASILWFMEATAAIAPSTYTLHLPYEDVGTGPEAVAQWQARCRESIENLIAQGVAGSALSIETLDYPFDWVDGIVRDLNLSVCIDLGHLMIHGFAAEETFQKYAPVTSIIHLHGVADGKDHLALDRLGEDDTRRVMGLLERFSGVVSLEVFSFDNLEKSTARLEHCWRKYR